MHDLGEFLGIDFPCENCQFNSEVNGKFDPDVDTFPYCTFGGDRKTYRCPMVKGKDRKVLEEYRKYAMKRDYENRVPMTEADGRRIDAIANDIVEGLKKLGGRI